MNTKTFLARLTCTGLFAALVAAAPLKAQDSPLRFGAGLSVVNPSGYISDVAKLGFGLSFFGEYGLAENQALRGRVEYALFGDKRVDDDKTSATNLLVFADYIYSLSSNDNGLYVFAGLGFVSAGTGIEYEYDESDSWSKGAFGYSAGVGYRLSKNLGLEASYVSASISDSKRFDNSVSWQYVQVTCRYRF